MGRYTKWSLIICIPVCKELWVVGHGVDLAPAPLPGSPAVQGLVPRAVGEGEDEDAVPPPALPAAVQQVAVGEGLVSGPVLAAAHPGPREDVPVGEVVGARALALVRAEVADIFIACI